MGISVRKTAYASWTGSVAAGGGLIRGGSGAIDSPYSLRARETNGGHLHTSPEELIGAGLAGCFAMSLANLLAESGHQGAVIHARATVHLDEGTNGFSITKIALEAGGEVNGIDDDSFVALAQQAKNCPVSRALTGTEITLRAGLQPLDP